MQPKATPALLVAVFVSALAPASASAATRPRVTAQPAAPVAIAGVGATRAMRLFARSLSIAAVKVDRLNTFSLQIAKQLLPNESRTKALTVGEVARLVYIADVEDPAFAKGIHARLQPADAGRYSDIQRQLLLYHELFDVPCRGRVQSRSAAWPPAYECSETAKDPTLEPTPFVFLGGEPQPVPAPADAAEKKEPPPKVAKHVQDERFTRLTSRDVFSHPGENLASPPA